jgi:hypothetical protein
MPCPEHPRYKAGCDRCRTYARVGARVRYRQRAYGRYDRQRPAEPVRKHLQKLTGRYRMGIAHIARNAGVCESTVQDILYGRRQHVLTANADALLGVEPELSLRQGLVESTGTRRRIQALTALGYAMAVQARWYDTSAQHVHLWAAGDWATGTRKTQVSVDTAEKVATAYERYSMTPAPASRSSAYARTTAANHGWLPPLAWDDDASAIDDPDAKPVLHVGGTTRYDHAKVVLACAGKLPYDQLLPQESAEAIRHLNAVGNNDQEIADVLGSSVNTIGNRRRGMNLPSRYDPASYLGRAS